MSLLYRMGTGNGSGGDLKPFIINFTCSSGFIGKTVTMEFQGTPHAGETIDNVSGTVASDGTLTLYPMHDGMWKYYATSDVSGYQEGTITLEKWGNYPVKLVDTPNGATVTPTDDVQTWLHCADVWNKSYTTISEVVADTTTLNTLIANENANDYLVRSTTFTTDICSNESAMTYIGVNDYCANKLLADSTWLTAICSANEILLKKVLNVFVPTLDGYTGIDGGEVIYSSETTEKSYTAFDNSDETQWCSQNIELNDDWLGYCFANPVCVKKISITNRLYSGDINCRVHTFKVQARNSNGDMWTDVISDIIDRGNEANAPGYKTQHKIENNNYYKQYRVHIESMFASYPAIATLQFYGRQEV